MRRFEIFSKPEPTTDIAEGWGAIERQLAADTGGCRSDRARVALIGNQSQTMRLRCVRIGRISATCECMAANSCGRRIQPFGRSAFFAGRRVAMDQRDKATLSRRPHFA